jgi:hypothetical protein
MANELYLSYEALDAASKRFSELSDDVSANATIPTCETGIVDITSALSAINGTGTSLGTNLSTLSTIVREVKNEVITVDKDQELRYPRSPFQGGPYIYPNTPWNPQAPAEPLFPLEPGEQPPHASPLEPVPPSYVNPDGPFGNQHLDLPSELTPQGPRITGRNAI